MKDYCSFVPDKIGKYDLSTACLIHDYGYYNVETQFNEIAINYSEYKRLRKEIDKVFLNDLKASLPWYYRFIAYFYYFGVRLFGTPKRVKLIRKILSL